MMRFLDNLPIRWKLVIFVAVTSATAGLVSGAAYVSYQLQLYQAAVSNNLLTLAQILSQSCRGAVAFDDAHNAGITLGALEREPHILAASIYDRSGRVFAHYSRTGQAPVTLHGAPADGLHAQSDGLTVALPVTLDKERIGTVFLKRDLSDKGAELRRYAVVALEVVVVSLLAAILASLGLQHLISRPILDLAEAARRVSLENNYEVRVGRSSRDELGALVDRFNEMLGKIQRRDAALKAARDQLEERVAERTLELKAKIAEREMIQRDLLLAKDAAEASNQAKSAFVANMSHELRTPLNAIIGYSEMLEEDAAASLPEAVSDLRRIQHAGRLLLELINNILDVSKIEAGSMQVHPEKIEIPVICGDVLETVEPLIQKNANTLVIENQAGDVFFYADPLKLRQSLLNLLSNAAKFTKNGTVRLAVKITTEAGREWIDWMVSDTGIGIPADQIEKLFCSFSQVDTSPARNHSGTGLGLSISKGLCELMGGTIFVESKSGVGSTFTLRLPMTVVPPASDPAAEFSEQLARLGLMTNHVATERSSITT